MMKSLPILCIVLLLTFSCSNKKKVPRDILGTEKMEAVLYDIMQADQFLSDFVVNKDTSLNRLNVHTKVYEKVFALHGTTRDEFTRSFKYYNAHPALFKIVMDSINTRPISGEEKDVPMQLDDTVGKRKRFIAPKIPTQ